MHVFAIHVGRHSPTGLEWENCDTVTALNDLVSGQDESVLLTQYDVPEADYVVGADEVLDAYYAHAPQHRDLSHFQVVRDRDAPTLIVESAESALADDWTRFPRQVAVRIAGPEFGGFIRIPPQFLQADDGAERVFRDVTDPVWDWLIRQIDADVDVSFVHTRTLNSCQGGGWSAIPRCWPGNEKEWLRQHLLHGELIVAAESPADAIAVRAGLLQIHDFLHESHELAQSVEGEGRHANGDYWHAIMHRREPDYGNAKYWYRRVGQHPLFSELATFAQSLLRVTELEGTDTTEWQQRLRIPTGWDSLAFVDLCEAAADSENEKMLNAFAGIIQWKEMQLLLEHTCRDALGWSETQRMT